MTARLRSTGRKSSNRRDGAFAGTANADGITIAAISTALKGGRAVEQEGCRGPRPIAN
jgi:hypothetical protein